MRITKPGKYYLTAPLTTRATWSIKTLPAGTIIEIVQVDKECHKVIGPSLLDWIPDEILCEPVVENG